MVASQHNAWIHAMATVVVVSAGFVVGLSRAEWIWIVLATVSSPNFHPIAEKAKDVAAGAVLLTAVGAVIVGVLVFWPNVIRLLE